jgi:hypothetical protein
MIFDLYDLDKDPFELKNLSENKEFEVVKKILLKEMEMKLIKDHDFLPLPSDILGY